MRRTNPPDFILLITVYILVALGLIMVFSASQYKAIVDYGDSLQFFKKQFMWAVLGLFSMFVIMRYDYVKLKRFAGPCFIIGFILLLVVLVPGVGKTVNGASRWIDLGFISFAPAEIFKLCMILFFAYRLSKQGEDIHSFKTVFQYLMVLAIGSLLILKQPDLGTALVLCGTVFVMFIAAGIRVFHIVGVVSAGIFLAYIAIITSSYRKARLTSFLNPENDLQNTGYQLIQSLYAFATGGLFGKGLGQGGQKLLYLPEIHTDFIFAAIGEELGFIGANLVILLFFILIWRGYKIATQVSDPFASLLAAGITSYIAVQACINMGMVIGLMPITGVPLPLISCGGTSLLSTLVGIGIILNISKHISVKSNNSLDTYSREFPETKYRYG